VGRLGAISSSGSAEGLGLGEHLAYVGELGAVDVGGLDDHQEAADGVAGLAGDVLLQSGELGQVAVAPMVAACRIFG
jgi:hypothetical protein